MNDEQSRRESVCNECRDRAIKRKHRSRLRPYEAILASIDRYWHPKPHPFQPTQQAIEVTLCVVAFVQVTLIFLKLAVPAAATTGGKVPPFRK